LTCRCKQLQKILCEFTATFQGSLFPVVEPGMGGFEIQVDIIMNVHKSVRKVPVILVKFE